MSRKSLGCVWRSERQRQIPRGVLDNVLMPVKASTLTGRGSLRADPRMLEGTMRS